MTLEDSVHLDRRSFLALASFSLAGCRVQSTRPEPAPANAAPNAVCHYRLYRADDHFSCQLRTHGFYVRRRNGEDWLTAHRDSTHLQLVFEFPPQHNAETAIDRYKLKGPANESFDSRARRASALMKQIGYLASKPAVLVFRVPRTAQALPHSGRSMKLALEHLLAWQHFEYITEDASDPYRTTAPAAAAAAPEPARRFFLGLETWKGQGAEQVSAIDLPTGFYLQPQAGTPYRWKSHAQTRRIGDYFESWSAFLVGDTHASKPLPSVSLELIDIHGVSGGLPGPGRLCYAADPNETSRFDPTPIDLYDRMEIAVTLSPRFGRTQPPRDLAYAEKSGSCDGTPTAIFSQCFLPLDHTLTATTYGISAEGGYLDFDGAWSVLPGCTVKGWVQKTHRGRDTFVKVTRKGWLNLHGFELELIEETERTYLRDEEHRLVAPNVKQVYIRVVQPAFVMAASAEECFARIELVTLRTPPLDPYLDASGAAIELKTLDAFIPHVDGKPFLWEFCGTDHAGKKTTWTQAGYFISNRQLSADPTEYGRFPEDTSTPLPTNEFGTELHYLRLVQTPVAASATNDDGAAQANFIKLVDRCWSRLPYRFGHLHGSAVAIAPADQAGDTTVELTWIEWVRGVRPAPPPPALAAGRSTVVRPLRSRARTLRLTLPSLRQFSGAVPDMLGTYRDLRTPCDASQSWSLDPEETLLQPVFDRGLLLPDSDGNASGTYLCVLPTDAPIADLMRVYFQGFDATDHAGLFEGLSRDVSFGHAKTTEGIGGLATPDSPVSLLTRVFGPVGDSSQNFAGLSACLPTGTPPARGALARVMQPADDRSPGGMQLGVDQLFGTGAEIIPGVKFTDVLAFVFSSGDGAAQTLNARGPERSNTLEWKTRIIGLEWLSTLAEAIGTAHLPTFLQALAAQPPGNEPADPIAIGVESSLEWSTQDFDPKDLGLFAFKAHLDNEPPTEFSIQAMARLDALNPQPHLEASCRLSSFALEFFKAINVQFDYVSFELDSAGNKRFDPAIGEVTFTNSLQFLQGLRQLLQSLGDEYGIKISISPQRAMVSQVLAFPLDGSGVVYLGPAAITNLSFQWGVIIPILGRDSTRVFVSLASRESPMTISVGIYGGRAYALAEADTRGPRLVEISADYGGVFPANFGVAKGAVSLTAGFTLTWRIQPQTTIELYAFAQFSGQLTIASIFSICAHIMVSLGYKGGGEGGDVIVGIAQCSCSFKLGFAEYSYSYSVHREERAKGGGRRSNSRAAALLALAAGEQTRTSGTENDEEIPVVFYPFDEVDGVDPRPAWADYFAASA